MDTLVYQYIHFCDNCPKAYDFTCSGADSKKCEEVKAKLLEKIKKGRPEGKLK